MVSGLVALLAATVDAALGLVGEILLPEKLLLA
jgi:hypothetical protein